MRTVLTERWKAATAAGLIITAFLVMVAGIPVETASGTCYERKQVCHGLPLDGCKGFTEYRREVVEKPNCGRLGNITGKCNSIGREICSLKNESIGESWASKAEVYGLSCSTWKREYDLELVSC